MPFWDQSKNNDFLNDNTEHLKGLHTQIGSNQTEEHQVYLISEPKPFRSSKNIQCTGQQ